METMLDVGLRAVTRVGLAAGAVVYLVSAYLGSVGAL